MTSLALDIGVHVFVTRAQKFPKINSAITARLTNAEQNKIILNSSLVTPTSKHASKRGKGFNAMVRGVVIPRDIIIIQKRKKLLSIFFKSLLIAGADFRLKIGPCQPTVKSANRPFVFFHETTPESVLSTVSTIGLTKEPKPLTTDLSSSLNGSRKRSSFKSRIK